MKTKRGIISVNMESVSVKPCFYDSGQVAFYDVDHSEDEDREILLGYSNQERLLLVVYTLRNDIIRIISARRATRREAQDYARGI